MSDPSGIVHFIRPRPSTAVEQPAIPSLEPLTGEALLRAIWLELRRLADALERLAP